MKKILVCGLLLSLIIVMSSFEKKELSVNLQQKLKKVEIPKSSEYMYHTSKVLNKNNLTEQNLPIRVETRLNKLIKLLSEVTFKSYHETLIEIISYETEIRTDVSLTPEEKEILLKVYSVVKNSLYDNGDRKDKDWDLSVGNIVTAVYNTSN